jgi:putative acetyltransferase
MIDGFEIRAAAGDADMARVRELFVEYQDWLGVDLCFQDFEAELAALPGIYAPPEGRLYLVFDGGDERLVGCVALRPRDGGRAEMKRLYVRPDWRRRGLGRHLTEICLTAAREAGYRELCLDPWRSCKPRGRSTATWDSARSTPITTTLWTASPIWP